MLVPLAEFGAGLLQTRGPPMSGEQREKSSEVLARGLNVPSPQPLLPWTHCPPGRSDRFCLAEQGCRLMQTAALRRCDVCETGAHAHRPRDEL